MQGKPSSHSPFSSKKNTSPRLEEDLEGSLNKSSRFLAEALLFWPKEVLCLSTGRLDRRPNAQQCLSEKLEALEFLCLP
jgi:hypothetical protein